MSARPVQQALLSVSNKDGIADFARQLSERGIKLLSTGGTAKLLREAGLAVRDVSDYTGFPEMMDGRVKTLHPKVHGGILGRRGQDDAVMSEHAIEGIDLVVVNLYPFEATVANDDCDLATAIENIDIGGPTMVRSAAKNHAAVTIVTDPADYARVLSDLNEHDGSVADSTRFDLAVKAFEHTAHYDGAIANWLGSKGLALAEKWGQSQISTDSNATDNVALRKIDSDPNFSFPRTFNRQYQKADDLRYGENPHQQSAFYVEAGDNEASISTAKQLQGKALSYNNIADTDAALECVKQFDANSEGPACVIVKHANPCGVALGKSQLEAYNRAFATDPTSAFGGIIAFNQALDAETASAIVERQFVEVIIAPTVSDEAQAIVAAKKNVRLLACGQWPAQAAAAWDFKRVNGGLLVQDRDLGMISEAELKVVSKRAPTAAQLQDLLFTWRVAKYVKSNAIVYARDGQTIGVGAGQMSRVYSAKIAGIKAQDEGLTVPGSVMASDAFFPFRDGIDAAAEAGIAAIIQPGGSIRDDEVIAAADEHDIAMVFTGMRHFRH